MAAAGGCGGDFFFLGLRVDLRGEAFVFVVRRREDGLVFRFRELLLRTDGLLADLFRVELLLVDLERPDEVERTQTRPVVQ